MTQSITNEEWEAVDVTLIKIILENFSRPSAIFTFNLDEYNNGRVMYGKSGRRFWACSVEEHRNDEDYGFAPLLFTVVTDLYIQNVRPKSKQTPILYF